MPFLSAGPMRRRIRFFDAKGFEPASFDQDLVHRRRTFRHEMAVIFRCVGLLTGYWRWLVIAVFMGLIWSTLSVGLPWLEKLLFDEVYPNRNWNVFLLIAAAWIIADLQKMALDHVSASLGTYLNLRAGLWLHLQFYRRLQRLSLTQLQKRGVGEHMFRMSDDVTAVLGIAQSVVRNLIQEVYELGMSFLFLSLVDPKLALIGIGFTAVNSVLAWIYATWRRKVELMRRATKEKSDARLQEGLAGALTVKVFGRQNHETASYLHTVSRMMRVASFFVLINQIFNQLTAGINFLRNAAIYGFLHYMVIKGEMSYGMVFVIIPYLTRLDDPIETLIKTINDMRNRVAPAERFFQTWDEKPAIEDSPRARPVPPLRGGLAMEKLSFGYEAGVDVLKGLSLSIAPGTFTAVVGPSGSGKSTLLGLLLRLQDPGSGKVTVDGMDLRELRQRDYQAKIGVVLQDTFVFKGTVAENLRFSNPRATDAELRRALEQVQLGPFLAGLPDGLDSDLAEGGRLSGGERQRIGLARALLRRPEFWLLDEPTSSLDPRTEREVMELFRKVRGTRTAVMVTHRLNTLAYADEILYLEGGEIRQRGTLNALLSVEGPFRRLYSLYQGLPAPASSAVPVTSK